MEPSQFKSFMEVLKTGSFSKAAKATFRTQPTVSLQIKTLETELGARLFERFGPMKVKPTKEGLVLAGILAPLLKDFDSVKKRFDEGCGSALKNEISIASHETVIAYLFPDIVERFTKIHKDLKFIFFRKNKADIVSMVTQGEVDFGVTTLDKVPRGVEYKVFRIHKRVLLLPKGHALGRLKDIKPKDIAAYPLILPPFNSETRILVDEFFKKKAIPYSVSLELTGRDAVKKYVEKGFGISIMSDYYLEPSDKQKMTIIDVSNHFGQTSRGILYRKGKTFSLIHRELLEYLLKN